MWFVWTPALAAAQGTTVNDAVALALKQASAAQQAVAEVAKPEASAAAKEAEAAAKAANGAAEAAGALAKATEAATSTVDGLKTASAAATKAAAGAVAAAEAAAAAAATVANAIVADPSKATASKAAAAAIVAAKTAGDAASKATAALAQVNGASTLDAVRKGSALVAEEVRRAAASVAATASECALAALEGAKPSQVVTTERDENVLAALRARITGGAIFFNGPVNIVRSEDLATAEFRSDQFGQAATYLALEAQPRLWSAEWGSCGRPLRSEEERKLCREARARLVADRGYNRLYVDPFVNVRLTTIPVAGAAPSSAVTAVQVPTPAFLQSQKAAQVQLGAMAGTNFGKFPIKSSDFHWGVGPVFRYMLQNVTDSQRALRLWDVDNDLFKIWTVGARITLYEKDQFVGESPRHGWAPAAYVDASFGRFENFESALGKTPGATACLKDPSGCLATGVPSDDEFEVSSATRAYVEARVYLQFLYLGFDLNTGRGADDLRFIAGLTVKLDRFITRR